MSTSKAWAELQEAPRKVVEAITADLDAGKTWREIGEEMGMARENAHRWYYRQQNKNRER